MWAILPSRRRVVHEHAPAHELPLLQGRHDEIRRILDRRELRGEIGGQTVVVRHELMEREVLAHFLEHRAVEVDDAVAPFERYRA